MGHHPDVRRFHRQRQIEIVDIGDVVIDQREQLIVRNFAVGFRCDLRIDQVEVVANRPLRELILGIVIGSLRGIGPIPHHDAIWDRVAAGLGIGDGAMPGGPVSQGIGVSGRGEILAVGSNADAGAIPEDQRKAHENALAALQAEIIFCALLVANVAAVFLVWRVVGIIQAYRLVTREDVRVRISHDRIHGVRGVVRDPQSLQRDRVAIRIDPIRQKLPGIRTRGGGIRIIGLNAIVGVPSAASCRHQVGEIGICRGRGRSSEKGSSGEKGGRQNNRWLDDHIHQGLLFHLFVKVGLLN
ncbi:MAG: hypothetical protein Udaeo_06670 [Candidatus Udaeobacter sp.]|nr:MAG: hypothetical protein Udaeo_06670 [Candidatus Udaeobacter sp.]